jgi:hypothetical protein
MAPMTRRDLRSFVIDMQRFRPLATVVLAALAVCAILVWVLTGMVLRYARMHAQRLAESEKFAAASSELDG